MRLFILGATGKTGRALVAQGLARGHTITAFGRSGIRGDTTETFRVLVGSPMRADDLAAVLHGHDAVLSALGTRGLGTTSVLVDSARASIEAMKRTMVRRLIVISSSLVDKQSGWLSLVAARTLLRHTASDQRAMEKLVTQSELDWTVLRPALLSDGMLTGQYAVSPASAGIPASRARMSREDVAHMMLTAVERRAYVKEIVWLRGARA
jgi:putative NADH-flavin reductase